MGKEEALRATNDYPVVRHGRLYWPTAIIGILVGGLTSFLVTKATVDDLKRWKDKEEAAMNDVATKADVMAVGQRVDRVLELMIEHQEAHPPTLRTRP